MMKKLNKKLTDNVNLKNGVKGITLIALVVTIIVLLILAGVSISMLTGQNGILSRAGEAKDKTETTQTEEELKLAITNMGTEYYATSAVGTLKDYIFSNEDEFKNTLGTTNVVLDKNGGTITYKGKVYEVADDGTITIAEGVALSTGKMTLTIEGETKPTGTITATLVNVTGEISWTSSNTGVATVGEKGTEVTVTAVAVGETTITATCGKYSKTCKVTVAEFTPNPEMDGVVASTYYGQEIDYSVDLDGDTSTNDWKIFYNDGINVYIIASDYVKNTHAAMPGIYPGTEDLKMTKGSSSSAPYNIYWNQSTDLTKMGATNIFETTAPTGTKYIADKYLKTWKTAMSTTMSTNNNAKMTSALMDTDAWSGFAAGKSGAYAIGSPTVEMWVASWNTKHGSSSSDANKLQLYCNNASATGYYVGTTSAPTSTYIDSSVMSATTGYTDDLYYPHRGSSAWNGCYGYWLASPSAGSPSIEMIVLYGGLVSYYSYDYSGYGVRPVVCLPSGISITHDENNVWHIGN